MLESNFVLEKARKSRGKLNNNRHYGDLKKNINCLYVCCFHYVRYILQFTFSVDDPAARGTRLFRLVYQGGTIYLVYLFVCS